uniref:ATP synthase subunit O, mitochondrial n=1 Tax=Panagrolaimus sp. JU765 TaxID=591449 RepID=A0AC34RKG1_9BILA
MAANLMLKRGFSLSTAVYQQVVKTPIQVHGVEGRYASALYTAAYKQKSLETVEKDLKQIKDLYNTNKQFKDFVRDPTLKAHNKKTAIQAISKSLNISKEAANLVELLAENGRLSKLEAVINAFETIMRAHKGELFVQVTSAEPLSKKHESALSDALQKFAKDGQKLHITFATKPSIIGGLVVTIGDKYVDLSIASRIKKYTEALETAI